MINTTSNQMSSFTLANLMTIVRPTEELDAAAQCDDSSCVESAAINEHIESDSTEVPNESPESPALANAPVDDKTAETTQPSEAASGESANDVANDCEPAEASPTDTPSETAKFASEHVVVPANPATLFHHTLLDNVREGAIFVDSHCNILAWNQPVEFITGITRMRAVGSEFSSAMLMLRNSNGDPLMEADCPVAFAIRMGKKINGQFIVVGRSGREIRVNLSIVPVMQDDHCKGAIVLLEDLSMQFDMQKQIQDLHSQTVLDPLTHVANRSEFDRLLGEFVKLQKSSPFECSLIVCDLDFFKKINDDFGHNVGDQALISFAQMLKQFVRTRDVVARYGGEEFVILCPNCNIKAAAQRAEEIRLRLIQTPQQMLDGKCLSASFGVSELVADDTATDFFVRADEALLEAKSQGRNRVVQFTPDDQANQSKKPRSKTKARSKSKSRKRTKAKVTAASISGIPWKVNRRNALVCEEFCTAAPVTLLAKQLCGFKDESGCRVLKAKSHHVEFLVTAEADRQRERYTVDVEYYPASEIDLDTDESRPKTILRITIRKAQRSWFFAETSKLAHQVLNDLRGYLMITDASAKLTANIAATESGR